MFVVAARAFDARRTAVDVGMFVHRPALGVICRMLDRGGVTVADTAAAMPAMTDTPAPAITDTAMTRTGMTKAMPPALATETMPAVATGAECMATTVMAKAETVTSAVTVETEAVPATAMAEADRDTAAMAETVMAAMMAAVMLRASRYRGKHQHGR